ncbi:hypothetical protein DXB27_11800 [Parabacteroides gordonii]|nr:hypothetical protein DXB27_11800 [Parabacteroides gordonii]
MKDYDGENYSYSLFCDGYPEGVIQYLPKGKVSYEKLRQNMLLSDEYESTPDYLYEIDLPEEHIRIYNSDRIGSIWNKGQLIFDGTFYEAIAKYQEGT